MKIFNKVDFSNRVSEILKTKNVSGYEIAKEIGCNKQTIYMWLNPDKVSSPNADFVLKFCHFLKIDPYWLMYGEEKVEAENKVQIAQTQNSEFLVKKYKILTEFCENKISVLQKEIENYKKALFET